MSPARTIADRHARTLVALALVLAVLVLGIDTAYRAGLGRGNRPTRTDAPAFLAGARALTEGRTPFGVLDEHGHPYVYPPAPALVFVPLLPLGREGAAIVWYLVSVAVLAGGVASLHRALGKGAWEDLALPLVLVALPAGSALLRGQLGPVLAGLAALGAAATVRRRGRGGLAFGAATALKATPVLSLASLLLMRRPRSLAFAGLALALLLVLGPAFFLGLKGAIGANLDFADGMGLRYLRDPASHELVAGTNDYSVEEHNVNQSLLAVAERAGLLRTAPGKAIALALAGALLVLAVVPSLRVRDGDALQVVAALGLSTGVLLLVAPVAWHHHHVLLYPALAALAREKDRLTRAGLAAFLLLSILHFAIGALRPLGLLGLGTLIVLALAFRLAWRGRPAGATDRERFGQRVT